MVAKGRGGGVRIPITADVDGVKRGTKDAERALDQLNKNAEGRFKKFSKMAGVAAVGGFVALSAGAIKFGKDAVDAAAESEKAMARIRTNVEKTGVSYEKYADQLDAVGKAAVRKGFDDEDAMESASRLAQKNKDVTEGIRLQALAMDVARGRNISLEQATNLVIKAQMGQAGAVRRLGIDIDKSAKSKEILAAMESKFAGQADAYAKTQAGAADRLRVSWENFQESVGEKLIPIIAKLMQKMADFSDWLTENWPRIWAQVKAKAQPILAWLGPRVELIMSNVQNAIQLVINLLKGDWGAAWGNVKTLIGNQVKAIVLLAKDFAAAGAKLGKALGTAFGNAFIALVEWAINKGIDGINGPGKLLNKLIPGGDPIPSMGHVSLGRIGGGSSRANTGDVGKGVASAYMAGGGVVSGDPSTGDSVPAMLTPGEVVLNRRQQAIVGVGRVMNALVSTGAKVGMGGFAKGGVAAALSFAKAQLGEPYVWGGGHEGVVERRGWDCSGFASNAAARVPGYTGGIGTTMSLYPKSKPAKGNEPVVFGFLGMHQSDPRKQHMGIRINGQWFEAAGGGRGVIRGRSSWESGLRIPPGLESLSTEPLANDGQSPVTIGPSPAQKAAAKQKAATTKAIAAALKGIPVVDPDAERSASPSGAAGVAISNKATAAGRAAYNAGRSADEIREVMDDVTRREEIKWVRAELTKAKAEWQKVNKAIATTNTRLKTASKKVPRRKSAARTKALSVVNALKKKRAELLDAKAGIAAWIAELNAQALDLDIAEREDALEGQEASAAGGSDGGPSPVDDAMSTPDPNVQAIADQAAQRAGIAEAGQLAADQFIRTALGPGDLSQGGLTAWQAAGGTLNVTVQSLHPGDPNTLRAIVEAIARAANQTPAALAPGGVLTV